MKREEIHVFNRFSGRQPLYFITGFHGRSVSQAGSKEIFSKIQEVNVKLPFIKLSLLIL